MINLAKTLNNDATMISLAQIFVQQPRNSPNSQAVPYCQSAPQNSELNGLFQCQFQGSSQTTFVGGVAVGGSGTIPFGQTTPLSPAGSCPANPSGPITDGDQLNQITQNPGVAGSTGSSATSSNSTGASTGASASSAGATTGKSSTGTSDNSGAGAAAAAAGASVSSAAPSAASSAASTGSSSTSSS